MERTKQAVALRYRKGEDAAPVVLAKGKGFVAEAIMELARRTGVPTLAEPELVALLETTDIGEVIPPEAYELAAEVIAFIWRLDRRLRSNRKIQ